MIRSLLVFLTILIGTTLSHAENIFPNSSFDDFDGKRPKGWSIKSWNEEYTGTSYTPSTPGRDGSGTCFMVNESLDIADIEFTLPEIKVEPSSSYVFKGYYRANCKDIEIIGEWLDSDKKSAGKFNMVLPETQNSWCPFFEELHVPANGNVLLIKIYRRHSGDIVCFDDFTLRKGTLRDYAAEFRPEFAEGSENVFPIFGWIPPGKYPHFKINIDLFDSDRILAEYSTANFTLGGKNSVFGVKKLLPFSRTSDKDLLASEKDQDIWGYLGKDEPTEKLFPMIAGQKEKSKKLAPSKVFFNNLLPVYGFKSLDEYKDYLHKFVKEVKPEIITYDFYPFPVRVPFFSHEFIPNMELVRSISKEAGAEYGIILQVVAHGGLRSTNEAELRWQAYLALAYGSKIIGWFTFLTEKDYGKWIWNDAVIDRNGYRTRHYSMLRRINGEILKLGKTLLDLESTGIYHSAPLPKRCMDISKSPLVQSIDGKDLTIGEFINAKAGGKKYFMIVNRDFTKENQAVLSFKEKPKTIHEINKRNGNPEIFSGYDAASGFMKLPISPGDGRLFSVE